VNKNKGIAVYIHFPFCVKKCNYCDFVSFGYSEYSTKYIDYLKKEVELFFKRYPKSKIPLRTLYIGGGTPSLLQPSELASILVKLDEYFDFSSLIEFTIEANPETVDEVKFREFRALGANRVSLGAQSFNDSTLVTLGRVHNTNKIYKSYEALRKTNFRNINIDLMFGLPEESFLQNMHSLKEAISLSPEHVSYYSLTIERGTSFYRMKDSLNLPKDSVASKEYKEGIKMLKANGFIHYEISNFAKENNYSEHNLVYWQGLPYIGFGLSSVTFFGRKRVKNTISLRKYFESIDNNKLPFTFYEHLKGRRQKGEFIILGLRLVSGLNEKSYYERFGTFPISDFKEEIDTLEKLDLIRENNQYIKLTKKGLLFANQAMQLFTYPSS
jgi:oxygen-independent coproporphyrinogen-3 oxidase